MLKVSAINLELKSIYDKEDIIENFARFLNSLNHSVQIICDSQIINPDDWKLKIHDEDYQEFLEDLINNKRIVEKNFYIAFTLDDREELEIMSDNIIRQLKKCRLHAEKIKPTEPEVVPYLRPQLIKVGDWYYDTIIVENWPYSAYSGWLSQLYNIEKNVTISMFIHPIEFEAANNFLDKKIVQFGSTAQIKESKETYTGEHEEQIDSALNMKNELVRNEGKFFFTSFYITIKSKSQEQLVRDVKHVKSVLKGMMIKHKHAILRQDDGFRCSLPHGIDYLRELYNFTTTPLKQFFPFLSSNIIDKNGIMIGKNLLNGSLVFLDHFAYLTASMLVIGKPGAGKSFTVKSQIIKMINQGIEVTVLDTENEFSRLKLHKKYKNHPNLRVFKYDTIDEYKIFLKKYMIEVNQSYESKIDFKPRFLVIDEFWRFMKDSEMAEIIQNIAKAGRKRWLGLCAITQEVEDLIKSEFGNTIINTSSIKIILKQEPNQKELIEKTFGITRNEWSFIVGADEGEGILFAGSNQVQFKTLVSDEQYSLITTKPEDYLVS